MKNEDKAMEICQNMCLCEHCAKLQFCKSNKHARCFHFIKTEKAVLEMAQWKDEQSVKQMTNEQKIAFMDETCKQIIKELNLYEAKRRIVMRTIKYRGKDVKTGKWKYGHLITLNVNDKTAYLIITDDYAVVDKELKPWEIAFFLNVDIFMVDPNTVGQFTGLTDKNGNEIYEDDIIHLKWEDYDDDFGVVKWHSNGYFYVDDCFGKFSKGDRRSLGSFFESIRRDYKEIEISINGNIHDNPELIR